MSLGLALALALSASACTSLKDAHQAKDENNLPEEPYLTGSYLKQGAHRNHQITDGKYPVRVLDQKDIENTGASDVNDLLRKQGVRP